MLRINEEKVLVPVKNFRWFSQSWRQLVTGAVAAVLLLFGAVSMNPNPIIQLADKFPLVDTVQPPGFSSIYQPDTSSPGVVAKPTDNLPAVQPRTETPVPTEKDNNSSPVVTPVQIANNISSARVFLNNKPTIKTTMLKVRVGESALAQEKVLQIAGDMQAQTQNLGQQVNENGSYTALKITVAKASANSLINKLGDLGTVISQEADNKDISTRYAETLSQYQALVTQRATLEDASQKAQLDQRIGTLQNELTDWEQQAEQETIVLWLEK